VQFNEVGLLNQESWKVVFYEGQPVGTIWITPDFRVIASDFNTYQDIGGPIQDVLNTINPQALNSIHGAFVSQASFDLYMLHIPTGGLNSTPDTICVYNLRTKKWSIWQPTDLISASLFNINSLGVPQWLFAASTSPGPIYIWDQTTKTDRTGTAPVQYPVTIRTSWLNMGDETLLKALNQQIAYTGDTALTLLIEGAFIDNNFINSPLIVFSTTAARVGPLGGYLFYPLAGSASRHYWYRFTWTSPASAASVVLAGYNTECIPMLRV